MENLLPLTRNKLKILKEIYEKKEIHMLEISRILKIHPFSLQKTLKSLKEVIEERKVGKSIILSINKRITNYLDLIYIIECFKLETKNKELKLLIKNIQELFSVNDILTCCLFGSYAREGQIKESDIDLLFVVKKKDKGISRKCSQISVLFNKEISPLIMDEKEFFVSLEIKEPMIKSLIEPSQRLVILGKEYFLKNTIPIKK